MAINKAKIEKSLKKFPIQSVAQFVWDKKGVCLNYVIVNSNIYNIGNMSQEDIDAIFKEIHEHGVCEHAQQPKRVTPVLREYLEANNMHELLKEFNKKTTIKTRQTLCKLTDEEKTGLQLDKFQLPNYLNSIQDLVNTYLGSMEDYTEPVGLFSKWFVEHSMINMELAQELMGNGSITDIDNMFKINNNYVNLVNVWSALKSYCNYYKINHRVDMRDVFKVLKTLEKIGVGV